MKLRPERASLVRESLYPVPDPAFPFLGVHLTRSVAGDVYVGPTAIPAFGAENYRGARGVTPGEFFVTAGRLLRLMAARDGQFRRLAAREMGASPLDPARLAPLLDRLSAIREDVLTLAKDLP